MQPFARSLVDVVTGRQEALLSTAEAVVATTPSMAAGRYSREELKQLLNGFSALLKEALEERGSETYELFLSTAVPGMIADGQTTETLVEASASFGTLISMDLVAAVPEEHREAAAVWLAQFFGRYAGDVVRAARESAKAP
jgi:hypothetical protein